MNIYRSIDDFPKDIHSIVTIGTFDGVHRGHKAIINRINNIAVKEDLESVLLTFSEHPRHVLFPDDQNLRLINSLSEKEEALSKTSLQNLVVHEFTKEFSRISSVNFIRDILVNKLNMKYMVVGYNHHFGKNREGTYANLLELADLYGFYIEKIGPQDVQGVTISSTKIRTAINDGFIQKANSYLCDNFSLSGKVVKGNSIGSSIGFPTANIQIDDKWKIIPKDGVYAVLVYVNGTKYCGMLNIGIRPTILDNRHTIEVNIFDFSFNIYDEAIKIEFISRIRDEKKFNGLEELSLQLEIDKINCKKILVK